MAMTVDARVEGWKQELLELSNRNPLLSMSRSTTRMATLRLIAPSANDIYTLLTQGGRPLTLVGTDPAPPVEQRARSGRADLQVLPTPGATTDDEDQSDDSPTDPIPNLEDPGPLLAGPAQRPVARGTVRVDSPTERVDRVGRTLRTKARSSELEQGINTLFATFGTLKWRESAVGPAAQAWRYAPLLLLPVRIDESVRDGRNHLAGTGDDPEFNQTLAERLRRDFRIDLRIESDGDAETWTP